MVAGQNAVGHNAAVGRAWAFAAYVAVVVLSVAGCTSSSDGPTPRPTTPAPITTPDSPSIEPSVSDSVPVKPSTTPPPVTISNPGPPHPTQPTVPPDVPTTGPNTRPGEKPPVMPLEATQHTARGAQAFAAFFIKTIDWGYATTSSAYMRHYMSRVCAVCVGFASAIDDVEGKHQHYVGGRFRTTKTVPLDHPVAKGAEHTALVSVDVEPFRIATSDGSTISRGHGLRGQRFEVSVAWSDVHWRVVQLGVVV